jgi:hypothetical protein
MHRLHHQGGKNSHRRKNLNSHIVTGVQEGKISADLLSMDLNPGS